jgi:hypothetical protein
MGRKRGWVGTGAYTHNSSGGGVWVATGVQAALRCRGGGEGRWLLAYEGRSSCSCRVRVGRQRVFDR